MGYASIYEAVLAPPRDNAGIPSGTGDGWRFVAQILIASGGARVGLAQVGVARVSSYQWLDLHGFTGAAFEQGGSSDSQGWPRAANGVAQIQLLNDSGEYSPLNTALHTIVGAHVDNAQAWQEYAPGRVLRLAMFKNGASTDVTAVGATAFVDIDYTDWQPIYTGEIESWQELELVGGNRVTITAVESLASLAAINEEPLAAAVGAGDSLIERLDRILEASAWRYQITRANRSAGHLVFTDSTYQYTYSGGTLLEGNRLAELHISGDSIIYTQLFPGRAGELRAGFDAEVDLEAIVTATPPCTPDTIAHLTTEAVDEFAVFDTDYFPAKVTGYIEAPVAVRSDLAAIVNEVWINGGSSSPIAASIARYGRRSLALTGIIATPVPALDFIGAYALNTGLLPAALTDLPGATSLEQTITVGPLTITDQHAVQRLLEPGRSVIVDYRPHALAQTARTLARVAHLGHTITALKNAITWQTVATISRNSTTWQPTPD